MVKKSNELKKTKTNKDTETSNKDATKQPNIVETQKG